MVRRVALAMVVVVLAGGCYRAFDFDNDNKADPVVVTSVGAWRNLTKPTADPPMYVQGGTDQAVPADYDGDGRADVAVLTTAGDWVTQTSVGTVHFPAPPQLDAYTVQQPSRYRMDPVPADYDGDHKADVAWYRDTDGSWFINGQPTVQFGSGPTAIVAKPGVKGNDVIDQDLPVPADYDGDGKADLAVFNPRTMIWKVKSSKTGEVSSVTMAGGPADLSLPAQGDYDGVHHAQRGLLSLTGWQVDGPTGHVALFGSDVGVVGGYIAYPTVADYDGDGKADLSFVSSAGTWHTRSSADTAQITDFRIGTTSNNMSNVPVESPSYVRANIERLTLLAWDCTPINSSYPADC